MVKVRHEWEGATPSPGGAAEEFLEQVLKLAGTSRLHLGAAWWPSIDVFEVEDGFIVIADLAGVQGEDIDLAVRGGRLHLTGVRRPPPIEGRQAIRQLEIDYGPFARTITLDSSIDEGRISAEYRSGLLLVRLPLRAGARRVAIRVEE